MSVTLAAHEAAAHVWFHDHAEELESRLRVCFRRFDPDARAEAVADCRARIWSSLLSAARRGTLHEVTPYFAAHFAHAGHRVGRRFNGVSKTDVMGEGTRACGRSHVVSCDDEEFVSLAEALPDPRGWDRPPENTRRDFDYPSILKTERVNGKARAAFRLLAESHGTIPNLEIARTLGVSPSRATQLKAILRRALSLHGYFSPLGWSNEDGTKRRVRSTKKRAPKRATVN